MLPGNVLLSGIHLVWAAVRDSCLSREPPCLLWCACRMLGFCGELSGLCAHLGSGGRPLENCPLGGRPMCDTVMTFVWCLGSPCSAPASGEPLASLGFQICYHRSWPGLQFLLFCFVLVLVGIFFFF